MNHLLKKLHRDLWTIAFLTMGVFLALALVSFNPMDPSLNSIGRGIKASNSCGIVGSFTADFFYQAFGLAAWVFILGLAHKAFQCFRGELSEVFTKRTVWFGLFILVSSSLLSLYFPQNRYFQQQILAGGLVGQGTIQVLVSAFNRTGVQIILWSSSLMLLLFFSEKNLKDFVVLFHRALETVLLSVFRLRNLRRIFTIEKKTPRVTMVPAPVHGVGGKSFQEKAKDLFFIKAENVSGGKGVSDSLHASNDLSNGADQIKDGNENENSGTLSSFFNVGKKTEDESSQGRLNRRKVNPKVAIPKRVEKWEMPKLSLLEDPPATRIKVDEKEIRRKSDLLVDKLKQFDVEGLIVAIKPGPAVTMFEFKPNADVKITEITKLTDDLALALSSESLRIIAPIPGRDVIGIETSNAQRETVYLKDLLGEESFWSEDIKLPLPLGRQANGDPKIVDLRKMPHLLVAGTTGSGKSVFTVSCITGLLFRHSPKTMRLILVDPKQVDLAAFSEVPHLLMPPVTDPKKAVVALKWAVREMEKRYRSMKKFGARGIEGFNEIVAKMSAEQIAEHEKINQAYEAQGAMKLEQYYWNPQPYIVIVVEEFGDLMAVDRQNVEQSVVRLAQMARACGIHLILAMQSPRKEVVTGLIKTNIPGRISFKVASKMDSRIILDDSGGERLLAQGDMLFLAPGLAKPLRHHGPFLKETEITGVAKFWSAQAEPVFDEIAMKTLEGGPEGGVDGEFSSGGNADSEDYDEKYDEILSWASEQKEVSASLIQRRFRLGYPRAARLIELFEREGVVGPANGSKPRQVLVGSMKDLA